MKKKILILAMLILVICLATFCFTGCNTTLNSETFNYYGEWECVLPITLKENEQSSFLLQSIIFDEQSKTMELNCLSNKIKYYFYGSQPNTSNSTANINILFYEKSENKKITFGADIVIHSDNMITIDSPSFADTYTIQGTLLLRRKSASKEDLFNDTSTKYIKAFGSGDKTIYTTNFNTYDKYSWKSVSFDHDKYSEYTYSSRKGTYNNIAKCYEVEVKQIDNLKDNSSSEQYQKYIVFEASNQALIYYNGSALVTASAM